MDTTSPCEAVVYNRMHVEFYSSNEKKESLVRNLNATGLVVVRKTDVIENHNKSDQRFSTQTSTGILFNNASVGYS